MHYSDNQLMVIAQNHPKELAKMLISPNTETRMLVSGVEILGDEISDETIVFPVFRNLLKHIHANVREGTLIGLSAFFLNKDIPEEFIIKMRQLSINDPSLNVKNLSSSILKDHNL